MPIKPPPCPPVTEGKKPIPAEAKPPELPPNIDPKLLKILKKYKFNWRLTQLSRPVKIKKSKKYTKKSDAIGCIEPNVKPGVLTGKIPERNKDMTTLPLWKLKLQKKYFKVHRKMFKKKERKKRFAVINKGINKTWNSVYYYYRRAILAKKKKDAAAKASAESKHKKKAKGKAEKLKEAIEYCRQMAVPKKVLKPPVKPRKIVKDWTTVLLHLDVLAEPMHKTRKYKRPSIDSQYVDLTKVKPAALKYQISPHMDELAHKIPERYTRREKPILPGAVKRGALKFKITPRIEEISVPRKRADAPEMDVKENPFAVSKNALKYKITPRIEELAKPVERS